MSTLAEIYALCDPDGWDACRLAGREFETTEGWSASHAPIRKNKVLVIDVAVPKSKPKGKGRDGQ